MQRLLSSKRCWKRCMLSQGGWPVSQGEGGQGLSMTHQLRLVIYPTIYTIYNVLYIPGGLGFLPSARSSNLMEMIGLILVSPSFFVSFFWNHDTVCVMWYHNFITTWFLIWRNWKSYHTFLNSIVTWGVYWPLSSGQMLFSTAPNVWRNLLHFARMLQKCM